MVSSCSPCHSCLELAVNFLPVHHAPEPTSSAWGLVPGPPSHINLSPCLLSLMQQVELSSVEHLQVLLSDSQGRVQTP